MFRGNPAHIGVYDSPAPTLSSVKWKFPTAAKILSSPAYDDGAIYFGGGDQYVYCLNAADGTLRWKFQTGGPVHSSPAVGFGLVYVSSVDGNIYAVDAGSGKLKWKFATAGESRFTAPGIHGLTPRTQIMPDPYDVFLSSAVIAGRMLYIGSGDHHVYALDAQSGELKWKFATGNVVHASPAVAEGVVYIGSWDRYLYALDAVTGAVRWKYQTGDDTRIYNQVGIASSAAVANGTVYFGCRDGHFYALDAATGAFRWKHDNHMGWTIASPAIHEGTVYFPTSDGTRFHALDAVTGKVVFSLVNKAVSFSSAAVAGGIAYFGSSDGWLHAVDLKSGTIKAEFQTGGSKANASRYVGVDGKIDYAKVYPDMTFEGAIIGLDRMFTLGSILSSPIVVDGALYVGSADGTMYCLN